MSYFVPFCQECESILIIPRDRDYVSCSVCTKEYPVSSFEGIANVLSSAPEAFAQNDAFWKLTHDSLEFSMNDQEDDNGEGRRKKLNVANSGATIKEKCPKCGNPEMTFHTMQLRSVDEGQTVFYECPKCLYKYSLNT